MALPPRLDAFLTDVLCNVEEPQPPAPSAVALPGALKLEAKREKVNDAPSTSTLALATTARCALNLQAKREKVNEAPFDPVGTLGDHFEAKGLRHCHECCPSDQERSCATL